MSEGKELLKRVQKILNQKFDYCLDIEKDIEAYLAKPEPEPVAWKDKTYGNLHHVNYGNSTPLYTSPPRKDLSDDEILNNKSAL